MGQPQRTQRGVKADAELVKVELSSGELVEVMRSVAVGLVREKLASWPGRPGEARVRGRKVDPGKVTAGRREPGKWKSMKDMKGMAGSGY